MDFTFVDLLYMSAWPMEPPKAYGAFHLCFTLAGFALCAFGAWKLRNIDEKKSRILLLSVGLFLLICEVYKQLFHCVYLWNGEYNWGIFPFHFCSMPMYLCLIAPLLPKGRVQQAIYSFMGLYNLLGGAIAYVEPSGLNHEYWTLTLHAYIWHMMLVFVGLYLCFSGNTGRDKRCYKDASICFLILCAVAFCINLSFAELSDGRLNMFFVGPGNSPIIVFDTISELFGWFVSTAIYIPAVCLGAWFVFILQKALFERGRKDAVLSEK